MSPWHTMARCMKCAARRGRDEPHPKLGHPAHLARAFHPYVPLPGRPFLGPLKRGIPFQTIPMPPPALAPPLVATISGEPPVGVPCCGLFWTRSQVLKILLIYRYHKIQYKANFVLHRCLRNFSVWNFGINLNMNFGRFWFTPWILKIRLISNL